MPTAPVINLNGTSAEVLLEEYKMAYTATQAAIEALRRMTVHGRDFQTAPEGTYEKARAEQIARMEKLQQVGVEIVSLACEVQAQIDARPR